MKKNTLTKITPEIAQKMLDKLHPTKQRNFNDRWCKEIARSIKSIGWKETHQGIAFDEDGYLIDGQHRLHAIILLGITVNCWVMTGMEGEIMPIIDTLHPRNVGMYIRAQYGIGQYAYWAGAAKCIHRIIIGNARLTNGDADVILKHYHAHIKKMSEAQQRAKRMKNLSSSHIGGAFAFARTVNKDVVDEFAEQVFTGENLSSQDSAFILREWLLRGGMHGTTGGDERNVIIRNAVLFATMNKIEGTIFKRISLEPSGTNYFLAKKKISIQNVRVECGRCPEELA